MKLTKETLNEAMSGISARLITEAAPDSPELRERRAWVYAVRAAAAALVFTTVIFAALKLRPSGNTVTPGDVPGVGERSSVAVIDGLDFPITYTLDGLGPDSDGTITSVSVSAPDGYEAEFSDTQGQCFESMLLEVTHGGERFCVVCDIRSGNVNDFMREAEYSSSNVTYSWDALADDSVGAVTWRYDKTGVTFIAAAKEAKDAPSSMKVYALWAFDPRGVGKIFGCELKDSKGRSYFGSNLSLFPKNGSFFLSSSDGGVFAVLWDDSAGGVETDIRDIYDFEAAEATEFLPRILDSEYTLEYTEKKFIVVVKFKDGGVERAYEIDLRDGSMKDVSDVNSQGSTEGDAKQTVFDCSGTSVTVSWLERDDGMTEVLDVFGTEASLPNCDVMFEETGGTVLLVSPDGRKYYECELQTGSVVDFIGNRLESLPSFYSDRAVCNYIMCGDHVFITIEASEEETSSRRLYDIFCFDNVTHELYEKDTFDDEYYIYTSGDACMVWQFFKNVSIVGPFTPEQLFETQVSLTQYHWIDFTGDTEHGTLTFDGVEKEVSLLTPSQERETTFRILGSIVKFFWDASGHVTRIYDPSDLISPDAYHNIDGGFSYLVEVGNRFPDKNAKAFICDLRMCQIVSGVERVFEGMTDRRVDFADTANCDFLKDAAWRGIVYADDDNSANLYRGVYINTVNLAQFTFKNSQWQTDDVIPLHERLCDYLSEAGLLSGYDSVSAAAEFITSETEPRVHLSVSLHAKKDIVRLELIYRLDGQFEIV